MENGTAIIETLTPAAPRGGADSGDRALIVEALKALRKRRRYTRPYVEYYQGDQPLTYSSQKYSDYFKQMVARYHENICPAVIDAITDRLQVTGIVLESLTGDEQIETPIPDEDPPTPPAPGKPQDLEAMMEAIPPAPIKPTADPLASQLWAIWRTNRMTRRAGRVHKEATKLGDAFVIVWEDPEIANSPRIWTQDSRMIHVHYDPETEAIDWAAKFWIAEDGRARCNLYFRDRISKYQTQNPVRPVDGLPGDKVAWTSAGGDSANPHDRVPVFHFANDADLAEYGDSELRDVLPVQDALNKSVADMLVAMEFAAYPQRWATGMSSEVDPVTGRDKEDFKPGIDRLWRTADELAKFGEFTPADLSKFIEVKNSFKAAAADVVGIPAHYMQMTPGAWPSGESLKTSEARFVAKVIDRQSSFGQTWSEVMAFAAAIAGIELDRQIEITWKDASPRSDLDAVLIAQGKLAVGVSQEQNQRELGYTEEEIARMRSETQMKAQADTELKLQELNAAPDFGEEP